MRALTTTLPKTVFGKLSSRRFIILMLVGVLFSLSAIPAFACAAQPAPSQYPQYTLKEGIDHVPYVFRGTIMDIEYKDTAVAVVRVTNYFKGSGPEIVRISGFGMGADCQETVEKFQQSFFFVSGDPASGFHAASTLDIPNYVKPTEPDTDQFLFDVVKATGQQPSVPTQGGSPGSVDTLGLFLGYWLIASGSGILVSGVLLWALFLQNSVRY